MSHISHTRLTCVLHLTHIAYDVVHKPYECTCANTLQPEFEYQERWNWPAVPPIPGIIQRQYSNVKPVRWRYALEDLHVGGRGLAGDEVHAANEIFVSEQYKLIYVVSRKCASSAISLFLEKYLNASTHWCDPHRCPRILNDCTSICLDSRDLLDRRYLFFSFVQHPVRRGFKSMTTILSRSTLESDYVHAAALQIFTLLSLSRVGPSLGNSDLCA